MGRIIFDAATTLNGFIADSENSLDWLFAVEKGREPPEELIPAAAVMVQGATTYQWILDHEGIVEEPSKWQRLYGDKPTFVFTTRHREKPVGADVRFVSGAVHDVLPAIRDASDGGDIWVVGGGDLPTGSSPVSSTG
jgi:dihydrofolate reductase